MPSQYFQERINALEKAIIDHSFVFQGFDLVPSVVPLLVYLVLLCADEGALVDIGMYLDV